VDSHRLGPAQKKFAIELVFTPAQTEMSVVPSDFRNIPHSFQGVRIFEEFQFLLTHVA
jgi:hypothetical protein